MLKWLRWVLRWTPFGRTEMENNNGAGGASRGYPVRWSLMIIAFLISALSAGIIFLTYTAITESSAGGNQFVIGALIGLLPTGIAGLVALGTTLLNERRD